MPQCLVGRRYEAIMAQSCSGAGTSVATAAAPSLLRARKAEVSSQMAMDQRTPSAGESGREARLNNPTLSELGSVYRRGHASARR
jgi:hypothetical protein